MSRLIVNASDAKVDARKRDGPMLFLALSLPHQVSYPLQRRKLTIIPCMWIHDSCLQEFLPSAGCQTAFFDTMESGLFCVDVPGLSVPLPSLSMQSMPGVIRIATSPNSTHSAPFFRASKSEATLRILILISPAARESAPALPSSQLEPSRWGKRLVPVLRS